MSSFIPLPHSSHSWFAGVIHWDALGLLPIVGPHPAFQLPSQFKLSLTPLLPHSSHSWIASFIDWEALGLTPIVGQCLLFQLDNLLPWFYVCCCVWVIPLLIFHKNINRCRWILSDCLHYLHTDEKWMN